MPSMRTFISVLPCLALLISGCGLSDYEVELKKQQELLKETEEENDLLGPPVVITYPMKSSGSGSASGSGSRSGSGSVSGSGSGSQEKLEQDKLFFFRAPKGISPTRDDKVKHFNNTDLACYYFSRDPKAEKKDCPFNAVLIMSNRWEEMVQAGKGSGSKLHTYSLGKILKTYKKDEKDSGEPITVHPPRRAPLDFTPFQARPTKDYVSYIYVCERGLIVEGDQSVGMEFVVVFQLDDPDKSLADDAKEKYLERADHLMKISLETLAIDAEAVQLYKTYTKMHPVKTSSGKPAPVDDSDHGRIIGEPK